MRFITFVHCQTLMSGPGRVERMGEKCVQNLVRKYEEKNPLGRHRHRFVCRSKNDYKGIGRGFCGLDSSGCTRGPMEGCCEHGDEPSGSMK
jgi:hypothetical protein